MRSRLNALGASRTPCFFLLPYDDHKAPVVAPLDTLPSAIRFAFQETPSRTAPVTLMPTPLPFSRYAEAFTALQREIRDGNSYLANLTFPTALGSGLDLETLYHHADAPFKLLYRGHFVAFSPERFIRIENDQIATYPMKGTRDATLPEAEKQLLDDPKELAEHTMVVDLLRNDLSMVAHRVRVRRFRYTETISTGSKPLLQTSSEITGEMTPDWHERLGDILYTLLPAGSVTGTPKRSTVAILRRLEEGPRGYYTGVFGYYDGHILDSAVLIRYIEQTPKGFYFRSGGGITADSDMTAEYEEMLKKVHVPVS